jgi:hypothetical protein
MKAGKLTDPQKAWATELVLRDPQAFSAWLESAPVIVPHGELAPPDDEATEGARPASIAAGARREYRGSGLLQSLTSEEAYVADAVRCGNVG